ncbi:MAG: hypothetical protein NC200_01180 [Candidatus Gastranaerophilales bacterium]|nr:hypothetical protein [Candidatus Gastranaerophilales bacterium]
MCNIKPMMNSIKSGIHSVSQNASSYQEVASRTAQIHNLSQAQSNILKDKGWIIGLFRPIFRKLVNISDSFSVLSSTMQSTSRNIRKAVCVAKEENPDASKIKAKIQGVKESIPEIKKALKEISGINDVKAATQAEGKLRGTIEAGKAFARTASIASFSTIGTLIPIPGGTILGWLGGEKLADLCLGKPFTKQIKNLADNIKK